MQGWEKRFTPYQSEYPSSFEFVVLCLSNAYTDEHKKLLNLTIYRTVSEKNI